MIRKVLLSTFLVMVVANCAAPEEHEVDGWCYLRTGRWLAVGKTDELDRGTLWTNPTGSVIEVFKYYASEDVELSSGKPSIFSPSDCKSYIDSGYRIAQIYPTENGLHSVPMLSCDELRSDSVWMGVAGNFN